jgi:MFS family permease
MDNHYPLFAADEAMNVRVMMLAIFLMLFSCGQFIGAPILGDLADRYGRRKALLWSVFGMSVGLGLTAWSMMMYALYWLFIGRWITGFFAGNIAICMTAASDLSLDEGRRTHYFGYISLIVGVAFFVGTFLGGKLANLESRMLSLPLWLAALLTLGNWIGVLVAFRETASVDRTKPLHIMEGICRLKQVLLDRRMIRLYSVYFAFVFGWTILFQFTPVFFVQVFGFGPSDISNVALFMGGCWIFGSGYLHKVLTSWWGRLRVLEGCLLLFSLFSLGFVWVELFNPSLLLLGGCVMTAGMSWPLSNSFIASLVPVGLQGKILGTNQSVQSLAMLLAPPLGGMLYSISLRAVFLLSSLSCLGAALIYFLMGKTEE